MHPESEERRPPSSLEGTHVRLGAEWVPITLQDAREMQRALEWYLTARRPDIERSIAPDMLPHLPQARGDVWIERIGRLHIGVWILTVERGGLMLAANRGDPGGGMLHRFLARVERADGRWTVTSLTLQTLR